VDLETGKPRDVAAADDLAYVDDGAGLAARGVPAYAARAPSAFLGLAIAERTAAGGLRVGAVVAVDAAAGARPSLRIDWGEGGASKRHHLDVVRQRVGDGSMGLGAPSDAVAEEVAALRAENARLRAELRGAHGAAP
jgi:hypothetical protein